MKVRCAHDKLVPVTDLRPHPKNRNKHPEDQVRRLAEILDYQGWRYPVKVSLLTGYVTSGHGRIEAAKVNGWPQVPVNYQEYESPEQEYADVQADNAIALWAELDMAGINADLGDLGPDFDIDLLGIKDFTLDVAEKDGDGEPAPNLADRFIVPPFSVLDARQGYWQDRKRAWVGLGIESELGRSDTMASLGNVRMLQSGKESAEQWATTSIFDPVLTELAYRWFSKEGCQILDPFAGGSVRGLVASRLGRHYTGVELRAEQVEANRKQAQNLCEGFVPTWHCESSVNIGEVCAGHRYDLIFSCPPYADLEVYSEDPRDLSNMEYTKFIRFYREIIAKTVSLLRPNRFACFVVGEVREPKGGGYYRGFVTDTIKAFEAAGARLYNEMILVTPLGTVPVRAGRMFEAGRKVGKTHQNVLVFCNGDPQEATKACGKISIEELFPEGINEGVGVGEQVLD